MNDFEKCLERRSLVRVTYATPEACSREMDTAREDLGTVDVLLEHHLYRNSIATAYYAMFHAARALVLSKGYAEKSHFCLVIAFEALYGDTDEGAEFARALARARSLREHADYKGEGGENTALATAAAAARFVEFADAVLTA
jgi:uncharacterized protein (UPF0332 family)